MDDKYYNKFLKNISYEFVDLINGYINTIRNRYNININIHDIDGISNISTSVEKVFVPYIYHNNVFCNYIKKNNRTFKRCIMSKVHLYCECNNKKFPFYRKCYMDVGEFIYPVLLGNKVIAIICIGQFYEDINKTHKIIKRNSKILGMNEQICYQKFLKTARKVEFSLTELSYDIGMLCKLLSLMYKDYIVQSTEEEYLYNYKNNFIVSKTVNFIKANYNKNLTLDVLASNSYCNPSYLSYIFKQKMGISVINYINNIRINTAMHLLDITSKPITQIGLDVGYNNSSYFSRVFKQLTGFTPKKYRHRKS